MGREVHRLNLELAERHASIGVTRNLGLFGIIELVKDRSTREPITPFNSTNEIMSRLKKDLLQSGLFIYTHWHTLLIIPPLCITRQQLEEGYAILDECLDAVDRSL